MISIDPDFDGEIFRPAAVFIRKGGDLTLSFSMELSEDTPRDRWLIKVVDVMGNISYLRPESGPENEASREE